MMIYLLIQEEHPFDMNGRIKTKIIGFTEDEEVAKNFVVENDNFGFTKKSYKPVKEFIPK